MLDVILMHPQIPQNTGNIGRMCAITGSRLHLIHPLGFKITDKQLRRSGMDYWHDLDVHHHDNWEAFEGSEFFPKRLYLFTTHAKQSYWDVEYGEGDGLIFGNEGSGAPEAIHQRVGDSYRVKIPHFKEELRSLNLATSVGIAVYEGMRQITGSGL